VPENSAWPYDTPPYPMANTPYPMANGDQLQPRPISDHPEFHSLRRAHRRFGTRATLLSVGWFLLYVLLSSFAPGVMNEPLFGHLTVGLALGLGQFVVMAVTMWCYVRHMRTRVDPLARGLRAELHQREGRREAGRQAGRRTRGHGSW
jgi:uncharacterized membrane protein (DUF485 family)